VRLLAGFVSMHISEFAGGFILQLIDDSQFDHLFLKDIPLLDVRAPVEFSEGAFPRATNAPILNDQERELIGICYKKKGQQQAIELGHQLVHAEVKQQRVALWQAFANENPQGVLYCFRGGMRSALSQQWLAEAGVEYPRIKGGYKALRNHLLKTIDQFCEQSTKMWVVCGRTGSGKTRVIHQVSHALDLEKYANHRGSAFGQRATAQPQQINFENTLAIEILKKTHQYHSALLVEDESKLIGKNLLPPKLKHKIQEGNLLIIEESLASRIQVVIDEYVVDLSAEHRKQDPINGWSTYQNYLLESLQRIRKRLGEKLFKELDSLMRNALEEQFASGETMLHGLWIEVLLTQYYDKMYDYQLNLKQGKLLFKGTRLQIIEFVNECSGL